MTLGERIATYRTEAGLSQDQLAEQLAVSRQSVSKWETDGSVPELSKLLRLSEVFGVTLDALVKGGQTPPEGTGDRDEAAFDAQAQGPLETDTSRQNSPSMEETLRCHRQKLGGIVILALSAVALLLAPVLLLFLWPITLVGVLLTLGRRVSALAICWTLWLGQEVMCYLCTSVSLGVIVQPYWYSLGVTAQMLVAWCQWALLAALAVATVRWFRKNGLTLRTHGLLCGAWLVWLGVTLAGILTRFDFFRLFGLIGWILGGPSTFPLLQLALSLTQWLTLAALVRCTLRSAKRETA